VASSPALHYFILETFGTQWSKLNIFISCPMGVFYISKINNGGLIATLEHYKQYRNIYPSKLQTSECKNNLEILCDTQNKWCSYQSASWKFVCS
jgi:hypothetical protein